MAAAFPCGHPGTEDNTYRKPTLNRHGETYLCRYCKTCHKLRTKAWRESNREYYRMWQRLNYRGRKATRDRLSRAWRGVSAAIT